MYALGLPRLPAYTSSRVAEAAGPLHENAVGCMRFMEDLGSFIFRLVGEQEKRLRGRLTEGEWQGFISKPKNGQSPGRFLRMSS